MEEMTLENPQPPFLGMRSKSVRLCPCLCCGDQGWHPCRDLQFEVLLFLQGPLQSLFLAQCSKRDDWENSSFRVLDLLFPGDYQVKSEPLSANASEKFWCPHRHPRSYPGQC